MTNRSNSTLRVNADGTLEVRSSWIPKVVPSSRRTAKRSPSHAKIEITEPVFERGFALNKSRSGIRIAVLGKLPVGHAVQIRVTEDGEAKERTAIIRWVEPYREGCIAGLEFTQTVGETLVLDSVA